MRSFGVTAALAFGSGASNLTGSDAGAGGDFGLGRCLLTAPSERETNHQQQNHARAAAKHGELAVAKRGDAGVAMLKLFVERRRHLCRGGRRRFEAIRENHVGGEQRAAAPHEFPHLGVERPEILERGRRRLERALGGRRRQRRAKLGRLLLKRGHEALDVRHPERFALPARDIRELAGAHIGDGRGESRRLRAQRVCRRALAVDVGVDVLEKITCGKPDGDADDDDQRAYQSRIHRGREYSRHESNSTGR